MHPFDWGVCKPFGEVILLITAVFYAWAIWFSTKQWWLICLNVKNRFLAMFPAFIILLGMIYEAGNSIWWQTSSAHHQEKTHILAVTAIFMGLLVSFIIGNTTKKPAQRERAVE